MPASTTKPPTVPPTTEPGAGAPPPPPPPPPPPGPWYQNLPWVLIILLIGFGVFLTYAARKAFAEGGISDPNFMRGILTLIIALVALCVAVTLIYHSLFEEKSDEERFRRAREVYLPLTGILGTIIGFYFGSAKSDESMGRQLQGPRINLVDKVLMVETSKGAAPYALEVVIGKDEKLDGGKSEDGMFGVVLKSRPPAGTLISVTVTDHEGSRVKGKYTVTDPAPAAPTPPPVLPPAAPPAGPPANPPEAPGAGQ